MTYHSTMSNLNYRMQVKSEGVVMGSVNLHLNKANPITNMMVYDLLHKKEYTLLKEETRMIFQGDFEALRNLSEVTSYYPDTGLLVYDVEKRQLLLHLARGSVALEGIVIGNVMSAQGMHVLQDLRTLANCLVVSENSKNFFFRRTLNVSLAVSLLLLVNGLSFSPNNEFGWFVRDEKEFKQVFQKK